MEVNQNASTSHVPNMVYVTGFPMYTQPQDLVRVFSEYGSVNVEKLTQRYATLSFNNAAEAKAAINKTKKISVYGEFVFVKPFYTKLAQVPKHKEESVQQVTKGKTILSPQEILLSGEFSAQLENILMAIRLTQEEVNQISDLYLDLERVMQDIWPGCKAIPFGSITTGLGVKCSDADCFIKIPKEYQYPTNNYITKAKKVLLLHKLLFSDIVPIPNANTPIIKLYHIPSRTYCDLTFKTLLGTQNSKLIHFLLHADPRLLPMAVLIRYWAQVNAFTGTRKVTNYALTMMIIFYLQQAPISILPSIQWLQQDPADSYVVDNWNAGFMSDYERLPRSTNTSSVAELLGAFFQYYSTFDFNETVICPYMGRPLKKADFVDNSALPAGFERYVSNIEKRLSLPLKFTTPICVQDPFEHSHNVACAISSNMTADLQTLFKFAALAFEKEKINRYRGFLRTILLQKPKKYGVKYAAEYKAVISPKDIAAITSPGWKSVIRDVVQLIFGHILGITLSKSEETSTEPQKEKVTFTANVTKAVWRRKHSSKMYYLRHPDFAERQKGITNEVLKLSKQTFELNFLLELMYTNEPRKVRIGIRIINGDRDLFREFGKFFSSIINPWFKTLVQPHCVKMGGGSGRPATEDDPPNDEDDADADSANPDTVQAESHDDA